MQLVLVLKHHFFMMLEKFFLLSICFFLSTKATALTSLHATQCDSAGICTIQRTLKDDKGKTVSLPYRFKYRPPKNGAPTVIYIPGGPGGSSAHSNVKDLLQIPEGFGVIQTDPLFVGVNQGIYVNSFQNATTSGQVARDIALAIESVGASDVIVYGVSYGTVPGTILASNLSRLGKNPRAVILDGTVGRAVTNHQAFEDFAKEWALLKERLGPETIFAFNRLTQGLITKGQITVEQLGTILQMLMMQRSDSNGNPLLEPLLRLSLDNPQKLTQILMQLKSRVSEPESPDRKWFHGVVSCKEIFPDSNADADPLKFTGQLEAASVVNDCSNYITPESVNLYDSKKYQISAPVIYLQGENDPATPSWQARYHAKNQDNMTRRLLIVPNAGHGMLNKELKGCSENFFLSLQRNVSTAANSLTPCISARSLSGNPHQSIHGTR